MALIFEVKVIPASGKTCFKIDKSGILKCYVKSQAEQGKANSELIKNFAKVLHISQEKISIITGVHARKKRIKIEIDISFERLLELCGIQQQMKLF